MDKDKQDISEYIKNLPIPVQDLVFDGDWEERTIEIGKKYALNDKQIDELANSVVLILVGAEKPENFLKTIIKELNISKILAEQITEDLEKRVFDYALKAIENSEVKNVREGGVNSEKLKVESVKVNTPIQNNRIPEIKPINLPIEQSSPVQKNNPVSVNNPPVAGVPKYTPPATSSYKPTGLGGGVNDVLREVTPVGDSRINYTPTVAPIPTLEVASPVPAEPIQRPTQVPRFNALADEVVPQTSPSPSSIMDDKLNGVTTGLKENVADVKNDTPIVKQYTVDPYREPLA